MCEWFLDSALVSYFASSIYDIVQVSAVHPIAVANSKGRQRDAKMAPDWHQLKRGDCVVFIVTLECLNYWPKGQADTQDKQNRPK